MKKMYWSKRNYLFKSKSQDWLLYAGLSNSFFSVNEELKRKIEIFIKTNELLFDDEILNKFIKAGVISEYTDEEFNSMYLLQWLKIQLDTTNLHLTIAPTLNCNFRCTYCYEKEKQNTKIISIDIINKIIDFIKEKYPKKLEVEWYGGEPLLCIDEIKYFNEQCELNNINLCQSIITNGYLLTDEIIKYFHEKKFQQIQVTIDGDKNSHNKRRPHVSNPDSFTRIMDNLELLYAYCSFNGYKPQVSIRVNIDRTNENDFPLIRERLYNRFGDFFYVYYGIVTDSNSCIDKADIVFNTDDEKIYIDYLEEKYNITNQNLYPKNMNCNFCCAQILNSYVIDPDGYMYKCWNDIGYVERAVKKIDDKHYVNVLLESKYLINTQVIFDKKCKDCFLLFSCQGGCPSKAINNQRYCSVIKNNIEEFLEKHFQKSKKKNFVY